MSFSKKQFSPWQQGDGKKNKIWHKKDGYALGVER